MPRDPTIREVIESTFPERRWREELWRRGSGGGTISKGEIGLPDNAEMMTVGHHLIAFHKADAGHRLYWYMPDWNPVVIESFYCDSIDDVVGSLSVIRSEMQTLAVQAMARVCHPADLFPAGARRAFYAMREPLETLIQLGTPPNAIPDLVGKWLFRDSLGRWQHRNNRMVLLVNGVQKGALVAKYEPDPEDSNEMIARYRLKFYPFAAVEIDRKGSIDMPHNRKDANDLVEEFLLRTYAQEVFSFLLAQKNDWGYLPI